MVSVFTDPLAKWFPDAFQKRQNYDNLNDICSQVFDNLMTHLAISYKYVAKNSSSVPLIRKKYGRFSLRNNTRFTNIYKTVDIIVEETLMTCIKL